MLLVDGIKYRPWAPRDEEKEFHPLIREHSKEIFGEDSLYFDVKHVLKTMSGIGSIPDAYVINLSKPSEWYVVENELASHPVYDHIVKQLTKFINGIANQKARNQILDILYDEINEDSVLKATVQKLIDSADIYRALSKLLSTDPRIVIIIDEKTSDVEEACQVLKYETDIVEFKTFVREDAENVRAHLFEPLRTTEKPRPTGKREAKRTKGGEITPRSAYTIPILETLIEMGGSGRMSEVLSRVHEKMKDMLKPKDFDKLPSGIAVRWSNRAQWERQRLVGEGHLKRDSPRGLWEITDSGRKLYENLKNRT